MSDPLGLLTGGALLGGALADAPPSPPTETPPAPGETRRAAGVSRLVPDEPTFPAPETPEAAAPAVLPPPTSPAAGTAEPVLTPDLLDDLLSPPLTEPPAAAPVAPQAPAAEFDRDPLIDTAPKQTGGGGGGGGRNAATTVSGGGGDDGAHSRGGLIEDADAGSADAAGGTALMMMSSSGGGSASGGGSGSGTGSGSGSGSCSGSGAVLAGDDEYSVYDFDSPRVVSDSHGVLNDDAADGGCPLTAELVSQPMQGTVDLGPKGGFVYYPSLYGSETDSFVYRARSSGGGSDEATVLLHYVNYAPEGRPDAYAALAGTTLTVSAAEGLLANDYDMNVSTPEVLEVASYTQPVDEFGQTVGTLSVTAESGAFDYTPPEDWHGTVTFTYLVGDGIDIALLETTVTIGVNDLHVFVNGPSGLYQPIDVTENSWETVVGAGITLSVDWVGPGFGSRPAPVLENHQWLPAGRAVKNYDVSTGTLYELEEADLLQSTVHFYWVDAGAKTVSVQVTADGTPLTAEADFNVVAPTGMNFASAYGEFYHPSGAVSAPQPWLGLGRGMEEPGIEYRYAVTAHENYGGSFGIIQTVSSVRRRIFYDGTSEKFWTGENTFVLDSPGGAVFHPVSEKYLGPGEQITTGDVDWPKPDPDTPGGIWDSPLMKGELLLEPKQLEMNENFAVFLMYKPESADFGDDAIYVPLWKFRWGFEASLSNVGTRDNQNWVLDPNSFKDPIAQGPTTQFPTWTTTVQSLHQNPGYQPEPQA